MHFATIIHYSRPSSHLFQMFLLLFRHAVQVNKLFKDFTITLFFLSGNKIQEISRPKHFSPTLYRLPALKYKFAKYLVPIVRPLTNKKCQRFVLFYHWNCFTRFQQIHGKLKYWVAMRPLLYYQRYVGDVFVLLKLPDHVKLFQSYSGSCHVNKPVIIKTEQNNKISLLNLLIAFYLIPTKLALFTS